MGATVQKNLRPPILVGPALGALILLACGSGGGGTRVDGTRVEPSPRSMRTEARTEATSPEATSTDAPTEPDWERWGLESDAWIDDGRQEEVGGRGAVRVLRPLDLSPSACPSALTAHAGIPTVRMREATVGPDPDYPYALLRRALRLGAPELDACAADCVEGTDLFEVWVAADGSLESHAARSRTHASDARTACLVSALAHVTLPAPSIAPSHLVFAIRFSTQPR